MEYPRYTTFAPGELEEQMRRLGKGGGGLVSPPLHQPTPSVASARQSRGSRLLKEHSCTVVYPDQTEGACRYERLGPAYHRFEYRYEDGALLYRAYRMDKLENTMEAIERAAKEGAQRAFREAVRTERMDRFYRTSEPTDGSRKKDPSRYQMSAKTAKEQAGKYAVCQRLGHGERLIPASGLFGTIEEANAAWKRLGEDKYFVACCNRLDRCWDIPKYNPVPKSERKDGSVNGV